MSSIDGDASELCKIIASLNYDGQQTLVTPQSFAEPNFILVYDLLLWFARILVGKPDDLSLSAYSIVDNDNKKAITDYTESVVLESLVNLARLFHSQLGIRLNLTQLYTADTGCCGELLRIAKPIHEAVELFVKKKCKFVDAAKMVQTNRAKMEATLALLKDEVDRAQDKRDLLASISELTEELENLLDDEPAFSEERLRVIDRRLELADIEQVLRNDHEGIIERTSELAKENEELCKDLERLDERLRSKEIELDESVERLNDLLVEAPQYLEQYERLYKEYESFYETYVSKYRSLAYLRSCVYCSNTGTNDSGDTPMSSGSSSNKERSHHQLDEALAEAKPLGSTTSLSLVRLPGEGSAGFDERVRVADELEPSATVGPARLAVSLPEGASKPKSASFVAAEGAAGGAGAASAAGLAGSEPPPTGRRDKTVVTGLRTVLYGSRPAVAGDTELEGLLREFAADSALDDGAGYELEGSSGDEDAMGEP